MTYNSINPEKSPEKFWSTVKFIYLFVLIFPVCGQVFFFSFLFFSLIVDAALFFNTK